MLSSVYLIHLLNSLFLILSILCSYFILSSLSEREREREIAFRPILFIILISTFENTKWVKTRKMCSQNTRLHSENSKKQKLSYVLWKLSPNKRISNVTHIFLFSNLKVVLQNSNQICLIFFIIFYIIDIVWYDWTNITFTVKTIIIHQLQQIM